MEISTKVGSVQEGWENVIFPRTVSDWLSTAIALRGLFSWQKIRHRVNYSLSVLHVLEERSTSIN